MARFSDYKVSVEETHHIHKLDAPSGTAITLVKDILDEHPEYSSWVLDEGKVGAGEMCIRDSYEIDHVLFRDHLPIYFDTFTEIFQMR